MKVTKIDWIINEFTCLPNLQQKGQKRNYNFSIHLILIKNNIYKYQASRKPDYSLLYLLPAMHPATGGLKPSKPEHFL